MAYSSEIPRLSPAASFGLAHHHLASVPQLDHLMLFGFASVVAVAVCYLHRNANHFAMLAFAASLGATAIYGFLEGAWPLGVLETAWALNAARTGLNKYPRVFGRRRGRVAFNLESRQSRYREIFGSN